MTAEERRYDEAQAVVREAVREIERAIPSYTPKWKRAWQLTEAASEELDEGFRRYVAGRLTLDGLKALAARYVNAWRDAGRQAAEAWAKRQQGERHGTAA